MSLRSRLKNQLRDRQFRHAYADEQLNLSIATQIKVIRENQKMSQATLAGKIGTKQAGISRIESANYDGWSIAILRRLAEAFDLRLRVSFEEFGTLWKEVDDFSRESLVRKEFKEDPEFKDVEKPEPKEIAALAPPVISPMAALVPGLSDLMASVAQQNEELRESLIASMDLSPILANLTSQQDSFRAALADVMKPAIESIKLHDKTLLNAYLESSAAVNFDNALLSIASRDVNSYRDVMEQAIGTVTPNPYVSATPEHGNVVSIDTGSGFSRHRKSRKGKPSKTRKISNNDKILEQARMVG